MRAKNVKTVFLHQLVNQLIPYVAYDKAKKKFLVSKKARPFMEIYFNWTKRYTLGR
jgi:hypothetical protein